MSGGYRRRLARDLETWITEGLVPATSREAILARIGERPRFEAAAALGLIGAALLGAAAIALTAANWGEIARLHRFALILATFAVAAAAAAWAAAKDRPNARNGLLTLAALIFAAAVGLTGQIFDLTGDPKTALLIAAAGATLLAVAGQSSGAAIVALALAFPGDVLPDRTFVILPLSLLAAAAALRWASVPLAHAAALGVMAGAVLMLESRLPLYTALALSMAFLIAALAGRLGRGRFSVATVFYGWWTWGALAMFAISAFELARPSIALLMGHRLALMGLGAGAVALGRHDRHALVTAAGVLALVGAAAGLLFDLGVALTTAAAIFGVGALMALVLAFLLRRRAA